MIADFCALGGKIAKRVFPPLNTTDYSSYVSQLPPPDQVDGTFWVIGGTGTAASLTAYEQLYGKLDPKKNIGNLFFAFLGADKVVAPKVVGSYVGGFGTAPGLKSPQAKTLREGRRTVVPGSRRRQLRRRVRLQLLQRSVGASFRGSRSPKARWAQPCRRACRDRSRPAIRCPTAAS